VYFGWLLFAAAVAALFWLGFAIRERAPESPSGGGTEQTQARASGPLTLMLVLVLLATTARPFWEDLAGLSFLLLPVGAVLVWWLARTVRASRGTAGHV